MKLHMIPRLWLLLVLAIVACSAVAWYLFPRDVLRERPGVAPPKLERPNAKQVPQAIKESRPAVQVPRIEEITVKLKRVGPRQKEPVDLDKFGDITEEFFSGQPNPNEIIKRAVDEGKSEQEITELCIQLSLKGQEYWRKRLENLRRLPENSEKSDDQLKKELEHRIMMVQGIALARAMRAARSTLCVSGVVVDDQGVPVSDVEVETSSLSSYVWGWGKEWQDTLSGKATVSGAFALRVNDAGLVTMDFRKPGYYPVRQWFFAPEIQNISSPEILSNKKIPPKLVEKRNLRIVMEKQGKMTRLKDDIGPSVHVSETPPDPLPEKSLYIVPKTDEKGHIALAKVSALKARRAREVRDGVGPHIAALRVPDDESQYVYVPTEIRLIVSDPQGGFARYEPSPDREIRPDRRWFRDMKEAPQEGYSRELIFDGKAIKKLFADHPDEAQPAFFYIKADGKYGKARFTLCPIRIDKAPDERRLVAGIEILTQPDGSRHLEGYE